VKRDDIIHPDVTAWQDLIVNGAHNDVDKSIAFVAPKQSDNGIAKLMTEQSKILKQIASKPEVTIGASDKGMTAIWQWGAMQIKYFDENTNW